MKLSNEALVVGLGDSLTAGAGLAALDETVTARLAERLSAGWVVRARSGLTARGVRALLDRDVVVADLRAADVVLVSVGVNDLMRLSPRSRWRRHLDHLLADVVRATPGRVVLLGMPPVEAFPRLPRAVGRVLGPLARRMDRVAAEVADGRDVVHVPVRLGPLAAGEAFAPDGFHPSAAAHEHLAALAAGALEAHGRQQAHERDHEKGECDAVR